MQFGTNHNSPAKSSRPPKSGQVSPETQAEYARLSKEIADKFGPDILVAAGPHARRMNADLVELRELRAQRAGGSVFKRARSRYWQLKIPVGDGWRYESSGTADRAEARRLLAHKVYLASTGQLPGTATFEQALDLLLNDARVRGLKSVDRMARAANPLRERLAGLRAKDVTHSRLLDYAAWRGEQCTRDTVHFELSIAKRALRLALRDGLITELPGFPEIKHLHVRSGFFDPDEWT
ncbi:MAG: hypothetical protein ACRD3Y_03585, partial [Bryobacteraceae bacterium]